MSIQTTLCSKIPEIVDKLYKEETKQVTTLKVRTMLEEDLKQEYIFQNDYIRNSLSAYKKDIKEILVKYIQKLTVSVNSEEEKVNKTPPSSPEDPNKKEKKEEKEKKPTPTKRKIKETNPDSKAEPAAKKGGNQVVYISEPLSKLLNNQVKFSKDELYSAIDAYLDAHKLRIKKTVNLDDTFKQLLPEVDSEKMSEFAFHKAIKKFIFYGNQVDKDGNPLPEVIAKREEQEKELQEKKNKGEIGMYLKPKLAEFMGRPRSLRGDITKALWKHIKEHNLQNPENKKEIIFDEKLKDIFGVDKVDMFKIAGLISKQISKEPLDKAGGESESTKEEEDKAETMEIEEKSE